MPYPAPFHRLVMIGKIYGDTFNTTLSIIPKGGTIGLPDVTQAFCTTVANVVSEWFRDSSPAGNPINLLAISTLTSVKLNRIGPDGLYVDSTTREHVFGTPGPGAAVGTAPAQISVVASLLTAAERGLASKGRMYLPPITGWVVPATDGRATIAQAGVAAAAVARLVNQINDVYDALPVTDSARGRVGVASNKGSGTFREVTRVEVGRVPDTMRSRRNTLLEDHQGANVSAT